MSNTGVSDKNETALYSMFKNMQLSEAVDSDNLALSWLETHQKYFYGFVDGCWLNEEKVKKNVKSEICCHKISDAFTGKHLCDIYASVDDNLLKYAAEVSSVGFKTWSSLSVLSRSKILFNVAQTIEKYQQLFAIVEAVSTSKHLYKVKTDISNFIENFFYYAGCALKLEDVSASKTWFPTGSVCVVAEERNNPSLTLSLKVSSLLASGNSVLLLADVKSSLSSFLLAEICYESGVPAGVLNVVPIDQDHFKTLGESPIFSKLTFTGSLKRSVYFSILCAQAKVPCEFLIPRRPVVIVYENADLHSAANGVLEAFFYHDTRSQSGGCKVLIQESIREKFLEILKQRFCKIHVRKNLSKTDMSCLVTEEQYRSLESLIQEAVKCKVEIITVPIPKNEDCVYKTRMPKLCTTLQTSCKLVHEELGGPVIVTVCFRTVKESISMFNCDNKGSPVSIWSEKNSVALEAALKLKSGVIWINSQNVIDTRAAFTGVYYSGNSVEGGQDALYSHMSLLPETAGAYKANDSLQLFDNIVSLSSKLQKSSSAIQGVKDNWNEYKLYIGGNQKSSSSTVMLNENTFISIGTESDLQSAISSALSVQPKWEAFTDLQKRKIFIDIMEKLRKNKEEYITELQKATECSLDVCQKEIDETLAVLYYWILKNDKHSGPVQEIKKNLLVSQTRTPLGVIAIQCPDERPLLSFISLVIPAIVYGNAVVAIASTRYPTLALKMCEVFTAASIPGGVINVIWGNLTRLVPTLRKHTDVNAVWYTNACESVYSHSNVTQRLFYCNDIWNDINEAKCLKYAMESTYTKSIFFPAGDIFSN